jgi:hypothetical protein
LLLEGLLIPIRSGAFIAKCASVPPPPPGEGWVYSGQCYLEEKEWSRRREKWLYMINKRKIKGNRKQR